MPVFWRILIGAVVAPAVVLVGALVVLVAIFLFDEYGPVVGTLAVLAGLGGIAGAMWE